MTLIGQFEHDLSELIDKYSALEMTNAEAVGVLEFQKFAILNQKDDDDIV
ncbi:MAG: hypothetical protein KAS32_21385 [Candidatus Peribacteraceae bacterium]|nr:hypothetical protein [Candidatus Peribacteraceae bacterium]